MTRFAVPVSLLAIALMTPSAQAAQLRALVLDSDGKPLRDAVVLAVAEDAKAPTRPGLEVVDQIDKEFVPYVKAVRAGSYVQFPNRDHIRHHVYSFSPAKRFELPLYIGTPAEPVLFDKPGLVRLGCNIHDWMIGYIYVADTPYFGKTGGDGRVALEGLPAGRYLVRVWHPRMQGAEEATVRRFEASEDAALVGEWKLKLKPEFRPRRARTPGEPEYR
jgi:plastocyanin